MPEPMENQRIVNINAPVESIQFHGPHNNRIVVDVSTGWGSLVSGLLQSACEAAGKPELALKLYDLLTAKDSNYELKAK